MFQIGTVLNGIKGIMESYILSEGILALGFLRYRKRKILPDMIFYLYKSSYSSAI